MKLTLHSPEANIKDSQSGFKHASCSHIPFRPSPYLIFTAGLRLHPFLSIVLVSILTGILAGEPLATVEAITKGLDNVFSRFAIIITRGSIIGILLQGTGGMSLIASDIIRFSRNPLLALNVLGFLFSVPLMCYILAYVIFVPIAKELAVRLDNPPISTATILALGAVASFNLVYPSPVVISAAEELSADVNRLFIMGPFIAVPTSIVGYLYSKNLEKSKTAGFSNRIKEKKLKIRKKPQEYIITLLKSQVDLRLTFQSFFLYSLFSFKQTLNTLILCSPFWGTRTLLSL
ncbi:GntT/GntP/DsdX family permease [Methanosarcina spelaei]|uniref:GntT/GntP/DsdX family permease n=1 Tax=Methanosarcina spelaei TaxID=1036679 RepID=UPI0030842775